MKYLFYSDHDLHGIRTRVMTCKPVFCFFKTELCFTVTLIVQHRCWFSCPYPCKVKAKGPLVCDLTSSCFRITSVSFFSLCLASVMSWPVNVTVSVWYALWAWICKAFWSFLRDDEYVSWWLKKELNFQHLRNKNDSLANCCFLQEYKFSQCCFLCTLIADASDSSFVFWLWFLRTELLITICCCRSW